jgi:hypothetical protein
MNAVQNLAFDQVKINKIHPDYTSIKQSLVFKSNFNYN